MKPQHKFDNALALDELAEVIHRWPGVNRRKLWHLHSELSRTAPGALLSRATNRTGFVGVSKNKRGRYVAKASAHGERVHIGTFSCPEDAYAARVHFLKQLREQ